MSMFADYHSSSDAKGKKRQRETASDDAETEAARLGVLCHRYSVAFGKAPPRKSAGNAGWLRDQLANAEAITRIKHLRRRCPPSPHPSAIPLFFWHAVPITEGWCRHWGAQDRRGEGIAARLSVHA